MGKEIQRKGSKVLLCFWQCGQVSDDLLKTKKCIKETMCQNTNITLETEFTCTEPGKAPVQKSQQRGEEMVLLSSDHLLQ